MEGASLGQATAVPLGIQLKQEHGQARTRAVVGSDGVVDEYTISVSCVLEIGSGAQTQVVGAVFFSASRSTQ